MAGTRESALKAAETKRQKYGKDFFSVNGKKGGIARNKSEKKHIPFLDREFASEQAKKAAKVRWDKYYADKA